MGKHEEAYAISSALIRHSQNNPKLLITRARCLYLMGNLENAVKHLQVLFARTVMLWPGCGCVWPCMLALIKSLVARRGTLDSFAGFDVFFCVRGHGGEGTRLPSPWFDEPAQCWLRKFIAHFCSSIVVPRHGDWLRSARCACACQQLNVFCRPTSY